MKTPLKIIRLKGADWFQQDRPAARDIAVRRSRRGLALRYFSVQEVARRLCVHPDVIYRAIKTGELESQPVGRVYRISEEAIEDYLLRMRIKRGVT